MIQRLIDQVFDEQHGVPSIPRIYWPPYVEVLSMTDHPKRQPDQQDEQQKPTSQPKVQTFRWKQPEGVDAQGDIFSAEISYRVKAYHEETDEQGKPIIIIDEIDLDSVSAVPDPRQQHTTDQRPKFVNDPRRRGPR